MAENSSAEQVDKVSLRVVVLKEKNKVLFAEAGKDFVDVLLSFLSLPLGTIAKLVAKDSNIESVKFGSISSLYQSVSDLDTQYLWSHTCKEMLLNPNNSAEAYCWNMKLNIDNTESLKSYYLCENVSCLSVDHKYCLSYFRNQKCICGKPLNREKSRILSKEIGFVKEMSTFIISDDLYVMPNVVTASLNLLQKLGVNDIDAIDKQTVSINITKKEVVDLLKLSLVSKTPLSDFIFKKEHFVEDLVLSNQLEVNIGKEKEESDEMVVKVLRRKSNKQILFVEAEEDFADFVFSFLTFPLGAVLHTRQGFSFVSCIDNLYKSVTELSSDKCLRSQLFKDILTSPTISAQSELRHQILPIPKNNYKEKNTSYKFIDPKSPISGGYAGASLTFMVTDELVVTPMSSIDGISYLERMKVSLNDVEEMVLNIGQKEVNGSVLVFHFNISCIRFITTHHI
ncbi:hypothetical protein MtrunA17_Chr7g0241251 [Medicago truncatula]|uniref:DUF674 family protein n=1 Tax=Medicago truncatula TaxID=3880 RepID=A0A396H5A7_MEDTR|nr:hypothetical protein MtrunA17_Chr7g0241251 [Medicago truncatula]